MVKFNTNHLKKILTDPNLKDKIKNKEDKVVTWNSRQIKEGNDTSLSVTTRGDASIKPGNREVISDEKVLKLLKKLEIEAKNDSDTELQEQIEAFREIINNRKINKVEAGPSQPSYIGKVKNLFGKVIAPVTMRKTTDPKKAMKLVEDLLKNRRPLGNSLKLKAFKKLYRNNVAVATALFQYAVKNPVQRKGGGNPAYYDNWGEYARDFPSETVRGDPNYIFETLEASQTQVKSSTGGTPSRTEYTKVNHPRYNLDKDAFKIAVTIQSYLFLGGRVSEIPQELMRDREFLKKAVAGGDDRKLEVLAKTPEDFKIDDDFAKSLNLIKVLEHEIQKGEMSKDQAVYLGDILEKLETPPEEILKKILESPSLLEKNPKLFLFLEKEQITDLPVKTLVNFPNSINSDKDLENLISKGKWSREDFIQFVVDKGFTSRLKLLTLEEIENIITQKGEKYIDSTNISSFPVDVLKNHVDRLTIIVYKNNSSINDIPKNLKEPVLRGLAERYPWTQNSVLTESRYFEEFMKDFYENPTPERVSALSKINQAIRNLEFSTNRPERETRENTLRKDLETFFTPSGSNLYLSDFKESLITSFLNEAKQKKIESR